MLAVVAPGQGSQTPGFLTPWIESDFASSLISSWSDSIGLDLKHLGTNADADEIRDTENAQPLLVAGGLIGAATLFAGNDSTISYFAGHSVGEITAAALAQVLDGEGAMKLVRTRGIEMAKAAKGTETGMAAVLGGERDEVIKVLQSFDLTAANENGGGQIVAAGSLANLAKLTENPPAGSRVRPLAVSGAFHTKTMAPAVPVLSEMTKSISINDAKIPTLSNKDGAVITSGQEVIERIVGQIAGPVRWDLCMQTLEKLGVTGVIEVPPAGTLVGLIKRAAPTIETFALKTPEDLAAAKEFIAKHGDK